MIKIKVATGFGEYDKWNNANIPYRGLSLEELLFDVKIEKVHVGAILVNGIPQKLEYKIEDNSEVYILPLIVGG
ncbi:MAG: hypothetical protein AB9844_00945 [Clostridiaceae bacterium]